MHQGLRGYGRVLGDAAHTECATGSDGWMQPGDCAEAFYIAEAGNAGFAPGRKRLSSEGLARERLAEALTPGIVVGITDRARGGAKAGLTAATARRKTDVLASLVHTMNDIVRLHPADCHRPVVAQCPGGSPSTSR